MSLIDLDITSRESFYQSLKSMFPMTAAKLALKIQGYEVIKESHWLVPSDNIYWLSEWAIRKNGRRVGFFYRSSPSEELYFVSHGSDMERHGFLNDSNFEMIANGFAIQSDSRPL